MSQGQAKAFVERMKSDEAFAARVLAVEEGEQRLAFIRAEGYDCSAGELAAEGGRLGDLELARVTAAGCVPPAYDNSWYLSPCGEPNGLRVC